MSISYICILILCAGAALSDILTWKIPNFWLLIFAAGGLVFRILNIESLDIYDGITGMLIPLVLLGWLFYFRMMGAADIKLLCVSGLWIGKDGIWYFILATFITAAVMAAVKMLVNRNAKERFSYLGRYVFNSIRYRQRTEYSSAPESKSGIHMALPVLISAILKITGVYS